MRKLIVLNELTDAEPAACGYYCYNEPVLVMVVFVGLSGKNVSDLSFQFCSLEH